MEIERELRQRATPKRDALGVCLRVVLLTAFLIPSLCADTIVVPQNWATEDAPSYQTLFGTASRYQQVYSAWTLAFEQGGPYNITQVAFRPDRYFAGYAAQTLSLVVRLSTTLTAPDALSTTFSKNYGPLGYTDVFTGPLTVSSNHVKGTRAQFDFVIPFAVPYQYDPSEGNLLLEVINYTGATISPLDSSGRVGDPMSRVLFAGSATAMNGRPASVGLITQFGVERLEHLPEPTSLLLFGTLAGALAVAAIRRRQRAA